MTKLFSWLKGLTIVHFAVRALKSLWPLILLFIFWPEIDDMMSGFGWWREYISTASNYVVTASNTLRQIPALGKVFEALDSGWKAIKNRVVEFFLAH